MNEGNQERNALAEEKLWDIKFFTPPLFSSCGELRMPNLANIFRSGCRITCMLSHGPVEMKRNACCDSVVVALEMLVVHQTDHRNPDKRIRSLRAQT